LVLSVVIKSSVKKYGAFIDNAGGRYYFAASDERYLYTRQAQFKRFTAGAFGVITAD